MHVPPNMTEEQTLAEITKVVDRIAPRYTFYGYELDDIKQESFIICADALPRYDASRPLENFLAVHLSNRLKNFVRDNHFIKGEDEKKKIVMPGQLVNEQTILDDRRVKDNIIDYSEMTSAVDRKLPAEYRSDYLKIINDVYVPKKRKEEVLGIIHEILEESGHA